MTCVGFLSIVLRQNNNYYYILLLYILHIAIYIYVTIPTYLVGLDYHQSICLVTGFPHLITWDESSKIYINVCLKRYGTAESSSESEQRSAWMILRNFLHDLTMKNRDLTRRNAFITWATAKIEVTGEYSRRLYFFGSWAGAWKTIIHSSKIDALELYTK